MQDIFLRLERLGLIESTHRFNKSRWDKTKWYTLDESALAELLPETADQPAATEAASPAASSAPPAAIEHAESRVIDDAEAACSQDPERSPKINPKSACASEPDDGARTHPLAAAPPPRPPANELDAAYAEIPAAERETWYEQADRVLAAAGMPDWLRIAPMVKEAALRLWVGATIPALASG